MNAALTEPSPARQGMDLIPALSFFVLGRPVTTNHLHKPGRGMQRYNAPETREWIKCVWVEAIVALHDTGWTPAPRRPLRIHCTFYGVRGDADNYLKATLDGLKIGLKVDDKWFSPVTALKLKRGWAGQGCLIEVWDRGQHDAA